MSHESQLILIPPIGAEALRSSNVGDVSAAFDGRLSTRVQATPEAPSIEMVLVPDVFTAAAAFDVTGQLVRFEQLDRAGAVVDSRDVSLRIGADTPFDWFFGPLSFGVQAATANFAIRDGAQLRVSIIGTPDAPAAVAAVLAGAGTELGTVQMRALMGFRSLSRIEEDDFGIVDVVKRRGQRKPSYPLQIPFDRAASVYEALAAADGQLCGWVMAEEAFAMFNAFGLTRDFSITADNKRMYTATLEITGAT